MWLDLLVTLIINAKLLFFLVLKCVFTLENLNSTFPVYLQVFSHYEPVIVKLDAGNPDSP